METFEKILTFLSGKKSTIVTIIMGIAGYLAAKGYVGPDEIALITGIVGAISGTISYQTTKMYNNIANK